MSLNNEQMSEAISPHCRREREEEPRVLSALSTCQGLSQMQVNAEQKTGAQESVAKVTLPYLHFWTSGQAFSSQGL